MLNCIAGIVVAWGPRCGQPFSACHYWWHKDISKGVKWDRTAVNAGAQAWNMIRPLSWIEVLSCQKCERETEAERDWVALLTYLVTHSLDNAGAVSFPLWSIVWCIFWMYEHLFMAHMLYRRKQSSVWISTTLQAHSLNETLCMMWLIATYKLIFCKFYLLFSRIFFITH